MVRRESVVAPARSGVGQWEPASFQGSVGREHWRCGTKKQVIEGPLAAGVCASVSKVPNGKRARKGSRVAFAAMSPTSLSWGVCRRRRGFRRHPSVQLVLDDSSPHCKALTRPGDELFLSANTILKRR